MRNKWEEEEMENLKMQAPLFEEGKEDTIRVVSKKWFRYLNLMVVRKKGLESKVKGKMGLKGRERKEKKKG